jgi:hypothetical protein
MATKVVFKAVAMSRDLAVRLTNRIKGLAVHQDVDADRFPTMKLSIGAKSCFVRIRTDYQESESEGQVDALGLGQRVYTPHVTEVIREAAATPPAAATLDMLAQVLAEVGKNGTKVLVEEATGVEDAADFAAAVALTPVVVSTIRSDDINPLTEQM